MKVAAFLGSPKKHGNTAHLLEEFLKGTSENEGVSITNIFLEENKILSCKACNQCKNSSGCILNDDMQKIYPIFKDADTLVFATPIYWWSMTGQMKTFVDRLYGLKSSERSGKKAYLLMTYGGALPNSGPELVEKTFRDIFDYIGIELVAVYGVCTDEYMPVDQNPVALKEVYELGKSIK